MIKSSRVRHEDFGIGTVIATRDGGATLSVRFDRHGLTFWIRARDLIDLDGAASRPDNRISHALPKRSRARTSNGAGTSDRFVARRLVEALRLGIVPVHDINRFTFGREREIAETRRWLADETGNFRLLLGEYGAGKSHFLECVRANALDAGYAVALVVLEPNASPLFRPKRLYRDIVRNLAWRDSAGHHRTFPEFLTDAAQRPHDMWRKHRFLSPLYGPLRLREMSDPDWDWICGREVWNNNKLHDDTTSANIYCNLLSAFSVLATDCLGLKGIVLLFDEAEMMDVVATQTQIRRGYNLLRALSLVCDNDPRLRRERIISGYSHLGQAFGGESGAIGSETALRYSGRCDIPFTVKERVSLKAMFAFAPTSLLDEPEFAQFQRSELSPLQPSAAQAAFAETAVAYASAYASPASRYRDPAIREELESRVFPSLRLYIKAGIEAMDLVRFYPEGDVTALFRQ